MRSRTRRRTVYHANSFYGFERELQMHAGWRGPVRAVVPHGVLINPFQFHEEMARIKLPSFFAYSWLDDPIAPAAHKHLFHNASPFLYFLGRHGWLDGLPTAPSTERKLLVFPSHSTTVYTSSPFSTTSLVRLEELREDGWNVTVCLYFLDLEKGRAAPFAARGFPVVTCGSRDDPKFLDRFVSLVEASTAVAGDAFGSHMFYAACLGRPHFLLSDTVPEADPERYLEMLRAPREAHIMMRSTLPRDVRLAVVRTAELFGRTGPPSLPADAVASQRESALQLLGHEHLRSREDLRELLARTRRLDLFNPTRQSRSSTVPIVARSVANLRVCGYRWVQRVS